MSRAEVQEARLTPLRYHVVSRPEKVESDTRSDESLCDDEDALRYYLTGVQSPGAKEINILNLKRLNPFLPSWYVVV